MAQLGYTPIQLYYSSTVSSVPQASNLLSGELAINITDGKLFYKDNLGVVQTIATKSGANPVTTISFGTTGLTPSVATSGAVTVAGTLAIANGGTGATTASSAINALLPSQTGNNGLVLTTNGTNVSWSIGEPILQKVIDTTNSPMGFDTLTATTSSSISFNNSTRTFSIQPTSTSFNVWVKGTQYVKTATESVVIPNTSGSYYISYNNTGTLSSSTTFYDLISVAPVVIIYWNATQGSAQLFMDERHTTALNPLQHEYLHTTRGAVMQFVPSLGFSLTANTSGDGGSNSDAQISLSSGTLWDEDIQISVINTTTPTANTYQQNLAQIPAFYRSGSTGEWRIDTPTAYPFKQGTTRPTYNLNTAGTWTTPDVQNNHFFVQWICATNNLNYPVISIMGQTEYATLNTAQVAVFADLNISGLPIPELRPLYGLVFQTANAYTNTPKARLRSFSDVRVSVVGFTGSGSGVTSFSAGTTGFTPSISTAGEITLAGTLAISNGGTGQTTQQAAINALAGTTTSGQYLRGNGTNILMSAIQAGDIPTLNQNTTGTAANVTGTVAVANGGTGLTSYTANRVLYASSTSVIGQSANLAFDGTTLTANSAAVSTGNLAFSGTGQRITGDFSNATVANRLMFQTSTTNGNTGVNAIPNGTGTSASFSIFSNSDTANSSFGAIRANASTGLLEIISTATGTGAQLPLMFSTNNVERMRIDSSGNVSVGTTSSPSKLTVSNNSAALTAPTATVTLLVGGADGANSGAAYLAFGGVASNIFQRANGTNAAPTTLNAFEAIGVMQARGYNGTAYTVGRTNITFATAEVWTSTANGAYLSFGVTPAGGTATTETAVISDTGRLELGRAVISGPALDTTANAARLYVRSGNPYNDRTTAASGTVSHGTFSAFGADGITATNTGVTYTNASTVYIAGAPSGGTNVTVTNPWALFVNAGASYFGGYASVQTLLEKASIIASAPSATTTFDIISEAVDYYTVNSTTNFTLNIRGDASRTLNSVLTVGQSVTIALMVTNGSTAYYPNVIQIDGVAVTPKWQGGTAITSGNSNSIDVYVFTVIKTASATYTVLGTQTRFA
jgi:hypothetical protein